MNEGVHVDNNTISDAYDNFVKVFYPGKERMGWHFWAFLGLPYAPESFIGGWNLATEQAAHNARLLAGPHYHAVAQAMLANGYQHEIPCDEYMPMGLRKHQGKK